MLNYLGLPLEASSHAAELDHMLVLVHWLMLVLFVGWGAFFLFVLVHLSTKDVIHSFGLYEMRVKQDAIPGMDTPVWFTPTRAGEYEITCSQLCGLGHYRMRAFVTVQTVDGFRQWMADQAKEKTG